MIFLVFAWSDQPFDRKKQGQDNNNSNTPNDEVIPLAIGAPHRVPHLSKAWVDFAHKPDRRIPLLSSIDRLSGLQ